MYLEIMFKVTKNQRVMQIFKELFRYLNVKYQSAILTIQRALPDNVFGTRNWTP